MYADRYRRTRAHPGSLAAAATVTGATIMALMSSAPEIVPAEIFRNITAMAIPLDPPQPPPPPPEKRIETPPRDAAVSRPVVDETIVVPDILPPVDNGAGVEVTVDPGLPPGPPSRPSGGAAIAEPAPPVLVAVAPDARYARDFQPAYPPARERAGEEARVTVRVLVGTDGRVRVVEPVGAPDEAFFASTRRQALARWRFRPATRDGVPYEAWHTMSVRFQLTE